jgi:predicted signal transduction protein with EAL and GGDEF domain
VELPDGRAVSITNNRAPNAGWVSTHDDVTERRRAEAQIAYLAHYDTLTGLPNRAFFCEELDRGLARVQRGERIALLYLDLDHFKRANDTLGHLNKMGEKPKHKPSH